MSGPCPRLRRHRRVRQDPLLKTHGGQAIKLEPNNALAYSHRGTAHWHKGDNDRAIADFDQAIKLDPKNGSAYSNRGFAHYDKRDYDRAITDFDQAMSALVEDLHERGLDQDVTVIAWGEFGRSPRINFSIN